jgi:hypothetical protein
MRTILFTVRAADDVIQRECIASENLTFICGSARVLCANMWELDACSSIGGMQSTS